MEKLLDTYLEKNDLTRYRLSKQTDLSPTTLQRSSDKDAFTINPRVLWGISLVTDKTPGKILDELIELEMENMMTAEEIVLLMTKTFKELNVKSFIYTEDMGYNEPAVMIELDLPSEETVSFAINAYSEEETATKDKVLFYLANGMKSFDEESDEDDGLLLPPYVDASENAPLVVSEYVGLSKEDADYLYDLGLKINKVY